MNPLSDVPAWVLKPLPANSTSDEELQAKVLRLCEQLPGTLVELDQLLQGVKAYREYDQAANVAAAGVWRALDRCFACPVVETRRDLVRFAAEHLGPELQARIFRRLAKDINGRIRSLVRRRVVISSLREVALPLTRTGDWNPTGWLRGSAPGRLSRHAQGRRVQERLGLPQLRTVGEMRELLGIRSERQLGYFLLASDAGNGPYTKFTIPKRDGSTRDICAPRGQLRWVQQQILRKILDKVPPHRAAHGFIPGRSTVTNAEPHRGARVILKFDLTDFFPTIHYYRVLGLFASLGYYVEDARFHREDAARQVAPTLARLCCYTPDPRAWASAVLPQGAPSSPALSNLVCRRLDARLEGLARRNGGVYTRYADDLTFSFKQEDVNLGRFRWWVDQVCHQEGFFVNQKKFRVIRSSQRQLVTGIVVNDELRVPREERRRFRAILHNCQRQGWESQARGRLGFADYLRGFASYIHMVHPEEGEDLLRQVEALFGPGGEEEGHE
jgi:retron-type reverse transcriptase